MTWPDLGSDRCVSCLRGGMAVKEKKKSGIRNPSRRLGYQSGTVMISYHKMVSRCRAAGQRTYLENEPNKKQISAVDC